MLVFCLVYSSQTLLVVFELNNCQASPCLAPHAFPHMLLMTCQFSGRATLPGIRFLTGLSGFLTTCSGTNFIQNRARASPGSAPLP
jgi:hypothetical protein